MIRTTRIFLVVASLLSFGAAADSKQDSLRAAVAKLAPGAQIDAVTKSTVPGLYEVQAGATIWYITDDGRFLIDGDVYDVNKRINLSAAKREAGTAKAVEAIGEENMIVFAPDKSEYTVSVFTDIDCGYCRKLHREMDDYNDAGITIRYLSYPRAGKGSSAYNKAVSSWCAKDQKKALTRAKSGQTIESLDCDNPVDAHIALGESLGITGTPTMVLASGEMLPGYVPAQKLKRLLDAKNAN